MGMDNHPLAIALLTQTEKLCVVGYSDGHVAYITHECWSDLPANLKREAIQSSQQMIQVADSIMPLRTHDLTLTQWVVPGDNRHIDAAFDETLKQWFVLI